MPTDLVHVGYAFLEGFVLIISPCILPILPIILSGSFSGSKSRPFGIITGFILIFVILTLFSRTLIQLANINVEYLRNISFAILLLIGIIMMSDTLTEKFNRWAAPLANAGSSLPVVNNPQGGFFGGILFGGLVAIIWTPCAGPILAAVLVQVVLQQTTLNSLLIVLAFAIGAGIPMLLIALFGRNILARFGFFRRRAVFFRQVLGFIIVASVIYFFLFQDFFLSFEPKGKTSFARAVKLINGFEQPYKAPEIEGISTWINSPPLTLEALKGKVVLVDFWTYSCINCIRTLPWLKDWYKKYHESGLEIIGIHSPEFQFEHDIQNVKDAVKRLDITWPVALDNEFVTWRNFQNEYWPAHYLINKEGNVVYVHFGEGDYDVAENNIRFLLGLGAATPEKKPEENYSSNLTPETYLGYRRAERFQSPSGLVNDVPQLYQFPETLTADEWALNGTWLVTSEKIAAITPNASIRIHFRGQKVYMVMGITKAPVSVKVLLNGKPIEDGKGSDVENGKLVVNGNRLYSVVNLKSGSQGELEIIAEKQGLEVYTFTFGN